jgi:NAD(P)-dependent dehydrogenase (short-subunit alcohol dehydrogenase family)
MSPDQLSPGKSYPLLAGMNAIITGGAQGLGLTIARRMAECGACIFLLDIQAEKVKEAAASLPGEGHTGFACDIIDDQQRAKTVEAIEQSAGHIDILVNNAGIQYHAPAEHIEKEQWRRVLELDLDAVLYMSQVVGRVMLRQGKGSIINLGSVASVIAMPRRVAYVTAKTALLGLTRTLAVEWAQRGLRVNAICPGYFATRLLLDFIERGEIDERQILRRIPMGKLGPVDAVGDAAVFLASPLADYITGQQLMVDGGWTAFGAPEDAST